MVGSLSAPDVARYRRDGVLFPVPVMGAGDAALLAARVADVERRFGDRFPVAELLKSYPLYLLPFVDDLMRRPALLDPVESILGPDIMVWAAEFFIKEPHSARRVTWHQDLTYWGLDGTDEVTAWLALTPATAENGCMRMVPGSHQRGIVAHRDTFAADNILSRGQEIAVEVDEAAAVTVALEPGTMSLHHGRMFHASGPNRTDARRIGFVVRYITPAMRQTVGARDYAVLVRGRDRFGHFITPPRPTTEFADEALDLIRSIDADTRAYLYAGAAPPG